MIILGINECHADYSAGPLHTLKEEMIIEETGEEDSGLLASWINL